MKKLTTVILFALLVFSCAQDQDGHKESTSPIQPEKSASETSEEYLARVNDVTIGIEDLKEEFNMLNLRAQRMFLAEGGLESFLDELIKKEMLLQEATKRDYESDPEFQQLMEDYKKRLYIGFLLKDEVEEKSEVKDAEVKKYYEDNRKDFVLESPEKDKSEVIEFEAVKELIRQRLAEQKKDKVFESYIADLKKSYDVEINEEAVNRAFGNMTAAPQGD